MIKKMSLLLLLFCPIFLWCEFVPYQGWMHTIESPNFTVVYPTKFHNKAQEVSYYAQSILEHLQPLMQWMPRRKILIILTDHTDSPNGMATPFPENTIYLYMAPSGLSEELRGFSNPLYSLVLHELTHILQLDQIRGGAWFWRIFFSRAYFPMTGAFSWFHEGTAVYTESTYGAGGRLDSAKNKAIIDSFARQRALPDYERIVYPVVDYPYNNLAYHMGGRFLEYLINTYGQEKFINFQHDLSNDFWPFVYEFVLKMKKVYGKSLKELWNDWREWEYSRVAASPWDDDPVDASFSTEGNIHSMTCSPDGSLFYSAYSQKKGKGIFCWDTTQRNEKLSGDTARNLRFCNNGLLGIRNTVTAGGFDTDDIYFYSLKNKRWKRLTWQKRITQMEYSESAGFGVYIRAGKAFRFTLNHGKIYEGISLPALDDFEFTADFHLSPSGETLLFSAQEKEHGNYSLWLYNMKTAALEMIPEIRGEAAGWLDEKTIYFIGFREDGFTGLYSYCIENKETQTLFRGNGFVQQAGISNSSIYAAVYTCDGMELQYSAPTTVLDTQTELPTWKHELPLPEAQSTAIDYPKKSSYYNPLRYLNPSWMLLPYQLNNTFSLAGISLPYITGSLSIYKTLPLGRFSYSLSIALDYINWYPQTSLSLTWKIPCTLLKYSFATFRLGNIFAVQNTAVVTPTFSLNNESTISFLAGGNWIIYNKPSENNVILAQQYTGSAQYSYTRRHPGAAIWNCGMASTVSGKIGLTEKQLKFAAVLFHAETRIPIGKHHFFLKNYAGYSLLPNMNCFQLGIQTVAIGNTSALAYHGGTFSQSIEMKSFSFQQQNIASTFISASSGALITVYRRTHYWKFLTTGFYALHLRPFAEYAFLYNSVDRMQHLMGMGVELIADFFVAYGNIPVTFVQGNTVGYKLGNPYPTYNGYFALEIPL